MPALCSHAVFVEGCARCDADKARPVSERQRPTYPIASPPDAINHPAHYTRGGIEAIDVIEAWRLGFCLGNAVKYISRAGHKDPSKLVEDLQKARWYLDRALAEAQRERP